MVQLLCPQFWEHNKTMDLAAEKRMMKPDIEQRPHKRRKSLSTHNEPSLNNNASAEPHSQFNMFNEPLVLGLKLRMSKSLLELCQATVSKAHIDRMETDHKSRVEVSGLVDNLKASNFPALLLRIGEWEYVSKYEGDLVAKCYFAKHKLVWEVLDDGLKNKIEIEWEAIVSLKAHCPDSGPGSLTIVLGKQPLFFRETNPQPRKHTVWQATTDFTDGEASRYRQHYLMCAQGVLNKHYQKLINCDTRLNLLSQQADTSLDVQPAANNSIKDPNVSNNNVYNQPENTGTRGLVNGGFIKEHGYVESWGLMRSKAIGLVNAQHPARVNNNEVNHNNMVVYTPHIFPNNTQLTTFSDEKNPMSGVNLLCNLPHNGNGSNDCSVPDAANYHGQEWLDGNDPFNASNNPTPENDKGMKREDSFTDLLHQLPQIEPLPRLNFETSQDGDIMEF